MQYTVVIEKEENTCYGAYLPEWPWAIGVGDTREEAIESIRESILIHLECDLEDGSPPHDETPRSETIMDYLVVVSDAEEADSGWRAFAPDLPGCAGVGATREEAVASVGESIRRRVDEARRNGISLPQPGEWTATIEVAAPSTPGSRSLSA